MTYDHSTKIGNQGDVVKHIALFAAIKQMLQDWTSDRDFVYADIHAGRPEYVLPDKGKWRHGILPLSVNPRIMEDRVNRLHGGGTLGFVSEFDETFLGKAVNSGMTYPGSSGIASHLLSAAILRYRMALWEKSRSAADDIEAHFEPRRDRIKVVCGDGYEVVNDATPFSLVLIDPPALEAEAVLETMKKLNERKIAFLCWTPRTSRSVKPKTATDKWLAAESGPSRNYIDAAAECGKCLRVRWHSWGTRTPGCCITASAGLTVSVSAAVETVAGLMGWEFESTAD